MSATAAKTRIVDLRMKDLEDLIERAKQSGLPEKDQELLRALVDSYAFLVSEIGDEKATVARLRRLLFGAKTEKKEDVSGKAPPAGPGAESKEKKERKKREGHGRIPAAAYTGAERVKVPHGKLSPGDPCPCCKGRVYRKPPSLFVRIRGSAPFVAKVYEQDVLRCGLCGEVFTAELPPEVGTGAKFDETVASMAALLRYGSGLPMHRIEGLQKAVGVPFPAATQWELMRDAASILAAAHTELVRQAAQGAVLGNDDTSMRILDSLLDLKRRRERGEKPKRTGTHTTGIVSELSDGRRIALYVTGGKHAGENLEALLRQRASGLDPPLQMCDGLAHNVPKEMETILGNCLVHARRQFVDRVGSFPEEVAHVVEEISKIYEVEARAKTLGLSAEERLRLHREASGPVMERLRAWMDAQTSEKKVEPNSGLGKAIAYCTKRWENLTLFLRQPGAPLDNNLTERVLKRAVLHRKNSLFYRTENGARVGDLFMSLIATAKLCGADPFDYLNELQRHADDLDDDPGAWMPWNYRETLSRRA